MGETLSQWVEKNLRNSGWSMNELARRAGISQSFISNVLSGKRNPSVKFYVGMEKAFNLPAGSMERLDREGVDPEAGGHDPERLTLREIYELAMGLTPQQQLRVLDYVLYLRQQRASGDAPNDGPEPAADAAPAK